MHDREEDQLTAAEREAFEALPREAMPGRLLEERVVSGLRARGLVRARQFTWDACAAKTSAVLLSMA